MTTRALQLLGWAAAVALLVAVAGWYLEPHLVVDLANKVWSCF